MMKLQFIGEDEFSLRNGKIYEAKKIHDEFGDGYAIYDEGDDWYRYGTKFVEKYFIVADEIEPLEEEFLFDHQQVAN